MSELYETQKIGPLLARLRQECGYSQNHLARLLREVSLQPTVTRHEVSRWERHDRIPSPFWLHWIAQVLGAPLDVLRMAVANTKGTRSVAVTAATGEVTVHGHERADEMPPRPGVRAWLTLHHGPRETVIALGGIEVDLIRAVLAPAAHTPTEPPPATPATGSTTVEVMQ